MRRLGHGELRDISKEYNDELSDLEEEIEIRRTRHLGVEGAKLL